MYPEVEAFFASFGQAHKRFYVALATETGHTEPSLAWDQLSADRAAAWDALQASADPLIRWIAENARAFPDEARVVLGALPASAAELDRIAEWHGWCESWTGLREAAEAAGVLPVTAPAEASER
jgi:hypothetical protein